MTVKFIPEFYRVKYGVTYCYIFLKKIQKNLNKKFLHSNPTFLGYGQLKAESYLKNTKATIRRNHTPGSLSNFFLSEVSTVALS